MNELPKGVLGWGLAAIVFGIFAVADNNSVMVLGAGFFAKCFAALVGMVTGFIGAMIGDSIRRFARPDIVFTSGISSLIGIKLFWLLGPQLIGLVVGAFIGIGLVLN